MGGSSSSGEVEKLPPIVPSLKEIQDTANEIPDLRDAPADIPKEDRATAAVVGGGFVGMHCAYELAKLGFNVTVIEQNDDVAMGATKYHHGTFGRPVAVRNGLWGLSTLNELFVGMLPSSAKAYIGQETAPWEFLRPVHWRWALARSRVKTSARNAEASLSFLAEESEATMGNLLKEHPKELRPAVIGQQTVEPPPLDDAASGGESESDAPMLSKKQQQVAAPAAPAETVSVIDPVSWTRGMRTVCEKTGVNFIFGRPVMRIPFRIANGQEYSPQILIKAPDDEDGKPMNYAISYDVVCIAAGKDSGDLTWNSYPLPLIPVSGYGVTFPENSPSFAGVLKTVLGGSEFLNVTEDGFLRASPRRASDDPKDKALRWQLSGLLSLNHDEVPGPSRIMDYLRTRLRVLANIDLPSPGEEEIAQLQPFKFTRGFSADGIPIVSRLGSARNVFVCAGFGDNTVPLAPGAAAILSKVLIGKLDEARNPFGMKRFRSYNEIDNSPYWTWPEYLTTCEDMWGMWTRRTVNDLTEEIASIPLVRKVLNLDAEME